MFIINCFCLTDNLSVLLGKFEKLKNSTKIIWMLQGRYQ